MGTSLSSLALCLGSGGRLFSPGVGLSLSRGVEGRDSMRLRDAQVTVLNEPAPRGEAGRVRFIVRSRGRPTSR